MPQTVTINLCSLPGLSSMSQVYLEAGNTNISISTSAAAGGGVSYFIFGNAGGGVGGGSVFSFIASGSTVTNALMLTGGSNITLSGVTDSNGMTLSLIGGAGGSPLVFGLTADSGSTGGNTDFQSISTLQMIAGSNIQLVGSSSPGAYSVFIDAAGGTGGGGANPATVSLIPGANIGITSGTGVNASSFTISAPAGGTGGGGNIPTSIYLVQGAGTVAGTSSAAGSSLNILSLIAGDNVGLQGGGGSIGQTDALEIVISASLASTNPVSIAGTNANGGGFLGFGGFGGVNAINLVAGTNITLSMDSGVAAGQFTTRAVTIHGESGTAAVSLVPGLNISIDQTTTGGGSTFMVHASGGTGGGAGGLGGIGLIYAGGSTDGLGSTAWQ